MEVNVQDFLSGVNPVVEREVVVGAIKSAADSCGNTLHQTHQRGGFFRRQFFQSCNLTLGEAERVAVRAGIDVKKRDFGIGFRDLFTGDFPLNDLCENGGHA